MIYELRADLHMESLSDRKRVIVSSALCTQLSNQKKKVVKNKVNPDVANR